MLFRSWGRRECSAPEPLISNGRMVLRERIELSTSPLPRECSTTELPQRRGRRLDKAVPPRKGDRANYREMPAAAWLAAATGRRPARAITGSMTGRDRNRQEPETRADRLRAALRANLQRRKAQARAREASAPDPDEDEASETGGDDS